MSVTFQLKSKFVKLTVFNIEKRPKEKLYEPTKIIVLQQGTTIIKNIILLLFPSRFLKTHLTTSTGNFISIIFGVFKATLTSLTLYMA